jgi:hypothetical protein
LWASTRSCGITATSELSFRPSGRSSNTKYALVVTTARPRCCRRADRAPAAFRAYLTNVATQVDPAYQHALLYAQAAARPAARSKGGGRRSPCCRSSRRRASSHVVEGLRAAVRRAPAPVLEFGVATGAARCRDPRGGDRVPSPTTCRPRWTGRSRRCRWRRRSRTCGWCGGAVGTVAFGTFRALTSRFTRRGTSPLGPSHAATPALDRNGERRVQPLASLGRQAAEGMAGGDLCPTARMPPRTSASRAPPSWRRTAWPSSPSTRWGTAAALARR